MHNSVTELAEATGQSVWAPQSIIGTVNAEFVGEPDPWHRYDAEIRMNLINAIEDAVLDEEERLRLPNDPVGIRKRIDKSLMATIDDCKDDYADVKKELLDYGVEAISDIVQFDDYFREKYGGTR